MLIRAPERAIYRKRTSRVAARRSHGPNHLDRLETRGCTTGMKTAISLPEAVFEEAERFARRLKKFRSQLYVEALTEYLARHAPNNITEAMNGVCDRLTEQDTDFATAAARRTLGRESW